MKNDHYGYLDGFGNLVKASSVITTSASIVVNPSGKVYLANGYKRIVRDKPLNEIEGQNIEEYYETDETTIYVHYRRVNVETDEPDE